MAEVYPCRQPKSSTPVNSVVSLINSVAGTLTRYYSHEINSSFAGYLKDRRRMRTYLDYKDDTRQFLLRDNQINQRITMAAPLSYSPIRISAANTGKPTIIQIVFGEVIFTTLSLVAISNPLSNRRCQIASEIPSLALNSTTASCNIC